MQISQAKWVTVPAEENSFWSFRRIIISEEGEKATLEIAADTNFAVFLNGAWQPSSQLMDVPPRRNVTALALELMPGENILAVSLYYQGYETLGYRAGTPGFAAILYSGSHVMAATGDTGWRYSRNHAYSPVKDVCTCQLGLCYEYDARKEENWLSLNYNDMAWSIPQISSERQEYAPREIPVLKISDCPEIRIAQAGYLLRYENLGTVAETCQNDLLMARLINKVLGEVQEDDSVVYPTESWLDWTPYSLRTKQSPWLQFTAAPKGTNGYYVIIDLQAETVGLLTMELEAVAGTVVDIAIGEHLDDGRVRCSVGRRNFADRYICKGGRQSFTHYFRRVGARYLELHITEAREAVRIGYIQLRRLDLPLPEDSFFLCDDKLLMMTRQTGIDTLRLCMHEHYEDCPWREQAMYGYDSRNQALYGYYVWGNYDFAAASFALLGRNPWKDSGFLGLTSPSNFQLTIPGFTLAWINEISELYLYSGNFSCAEREKGVILSCLDKALEHRDDASGLYYAGADKGIWNFFEWVDGLAVEKEPADGQIMGEMEPNALYNCYLYEALCSANTLFGEYKDVIEELGPRIESYFWNPEVGYYDTSKNTTLHHLHTQALMLFNGLVPEEKKKQIALAPFDDSLVPVSFSAMPYVLRAWINISAGARRYLDQMIRSQFSEMLFKGATSFWETRGGGNAFDYAGSLCHGWSSLPVYYCHAVILGVTPIEPGFKKFRVKPYSAGMARAAGSIPTPYGDIEVFWNAECDGVSVSVCGPEECQPIFEAFPEAPLKEAKYNEIPCDFTICRA